MNTINPNAPEKSVALDSRIYSVKQMQTARMLIGWIQQSFTPKSGIGQGLKSGNEKLN